MSENMKNLMADYDALAHAMQSGVKYDQETNPGAENNKHLRTGINMALVSNHAFLELLEKKGLITKQEYQEQLNECLRQEVKRYETLLTERMGGIKITLG